MAAAVDEVGRVSALWRYPVKSMLGEELDHVTLTERGLVGDRAYALVDPTDGKVASAKNPRKWGGLLRLAAAFTDPPTAGAPPPPVRIRFPDGTIAASTDEDVNGRLSAHVGRPVELSRAAPPKPVLEEVWPEIEDLAPAEFIAGLRIEGGDPQETVTDIPMGLVAPPGTFFDCGTVHLLTTATLDHLSGLYPGGVFDPRRYRPNVLVATPGGSDDGFVENAWIGREVHVGGEAVLRVDLVVPRCVMTTLAQGDLAKDAETLRTIARHNRVEIPGVGRFACAGVYASVLRPGVVHAGDPARLA